MCSVSVLFLHHFVFVVKTEKGTAAALVGKAGYIVLIQGAVGIADVLFGGFIVVKISAVLALVHTANSFQTKRKQPMRCIDCFALVEHSGIEPLTSTLPV